MAHVFDINLISLVVLLFQGDKPLGHYRRPLSFEYSNTVSGSEDLFK